MTSIRTKTNYFPKALPFLFLTELWERFGFYTVQGMLVLYMTQAFGFSDDASYTISGAFAALVYISPIVGGYLADKILGYKTAIFWGGLFLIGGYVLLASPLTHVFYLSLATIIIGNGLFKPNISSLLGTLYEPNDPRRDVGFTIFYVGINLGALLAGLSSGYVKNHYGWHTSFGLAALGLVIGLVTFVLGIKFTKINNSIHEHKPTAFLRKPLLILYGLITIVFVSFLLQSSILAKWLLPIFGIILLLFLFSFAFKQNPLDRSKLLTLIILILSSIVFWMLFLQMFFSVNLFIERLIQKNWAGFSIPTTVFYSIESFFVILLGPLLAIVWQYLSNYSKNPSSVAKFSLAMIFIGVAFLILALSTFFHDSNFLINPLWIALSYFLIALGELLLSPIGLSAVTLLSPQQYVGMMMGVWFVATGFGGEFAGWLAKLSNIPESAKQPITEIPIYRHAFFIYAAIALGVAIILLIIHGLTRKRLAID